MFRKINGQKVKILNINFQKLKHYQNVKIPQIF